MNKLFNVSGEKKPQHHRGKACDQVPWGPRSRSQPSWLDPLLWRHGCLKKTWSCGRSGPSQKGEKHTGTLIWQYCIVLIEHWLTWLSLFSSILQDREGEGTGSWPLKDWQHSQNSRGCQSPFGESAETGQTCCSAGRSTVHTNADPCYQFFWFSHTLIRF